MTPAEAKQRWLEMGAEERLAMAKTAPKVATAWRLGVRVAATRYISGLSAATIETNHAGLYFVKMRGAEGTFNSLAEAQSACDAELIRQGYVLENEE